VLLEHYPDERPAVIEHLNLAIAEFREMKMQPSLERALKHNDLLKADTTKPSCIADPTQVQGDAWAAKS
jgi:hypothetical protein